MLFNTENILTSLGILLHDVSCICRKTRKQCSGTQNKPWGAMLFLWQKVPRSSKSVDRKWEVRDVHLEMTSHWPKCVEERRYLSRGPCYYQLVAKCWESSPFAWFQLHAKWDPLSLPTPSFIVIISTWVQENSEPQPLLRSIRIGVQVSANSLCNILIWLMENIKQLTIDYWIF